MPRVVIVGGGFGGLYAARALRREPVEVTVVDRRNHHLFQPLLYQVAMAALSPGDIASPIRWILRRQKNVEVLLAEAIGVDLANRRLLLADGELSYDYLIVATGATHAYFGHDEWRSLAPGLKTLEDALEIRRRVLLAFERAERADRCAAATSAADVRRHRRRSDRRRNGRRARGDLAAVARSRLPTHQSPLGAHHPARRWPGDPVDVSGVAPRLRRCTICSGSASRCAPTPW